MFGSEVLDVVIGIVFIFLALSLVASAAAEILERYLKKRAQDLDKGISELLADPQNVSGFVARLYNHPLVNNLFEGKYEENKKSRLPSYIPARNFALALLDLDRQAQSATPGDNPPFTLPANVNVALRILKDAAGDNPQEFQKSVESWYDSSMDRVSGWYKRRVQLITFVIGIAMAVAVNADTVDIWRRLSTNQALRQGLVAAAQAAANKPVAAGDQSDPEKVIEQQLNRLSSLGLPIGLYSGWPPGLLDVQRDATRKAEERTFSFWVQAWFSFLMAHWLGWLLTGIAVSFGAPFWFDVLNKITVIRSTVKPHEKSPEENSED